MDRRRVQRRRGRDGADRRKGTRSRGSHRRASSGSGRRLPWQSCVSAGAARGDRDARRVARLRRGHDGTPCSRRDAGGARNRPRPHDAREIRPRGARLRRVRRARRAHEPLRSLAPGRAPARRPPRVRSPRARILPPHAPQTLGGPDRTTSTSTGPPRSHQGRTGMQDAATCAYGESPKAAPLRENPHESIPPHVHGKEGVDGSSPSEGSEEDLQIRLSSCLGGKRLSRASTHTEAWCSRDPAQVAGHYVRGGMIAINGGDSAGIAEVAEAFIAAFPDIEVSGVNAELGERILADELGRADWREH